MWKKLGIYVAHEHLAMYQVQNHHTTIMPSNHAEIQLWKLFDGVNITQVKFGQTAFDCQINTSNVKMFQRQHWSRTKADTMEDGMFRATELFTDAFSLLYQAGSHI